MPVQPRDLLNDIVAVIDTTLVEYDKGYGETFVPLTDDLAKALSHSEFYRDAIRDMYTGENSWQSVEFKANGVLFISPY